MELRAPHRKAHLDLVSLSMNSGDILMGGALADPPDKAVIIWKTDNISTVEEFVKNDPYYINGVVTSYTIRPWVVVINKYEPV